MQTNIRQATRSDIEALLPPGFDLDAFDALKIVSTYGWKIVEIDGKKRVAAASEADYRAAIGEMQRMGHLPQPGTGCQSYGPLGCSGSPCCRLWFNPNTNLWYCTC